MRSNQITNNIFVHVIITRIGHLNFTRNKNKTCRSVLADSGKEQRRKSFNQNWFQFSSVFIQGLFWNYLGIIPERSLNDSWIGQSTIWLWTAIVDLSCILTINLEEIKESFLSYNPALILQYLHDKDGP